MCLRIFARDGDRSDRLFDECDELRLVGGADLLPHRPWHRQSEEVSGVSGEYRQRREGTFVTANQPTGVEMDEGKGKEEFLLPGDRTGFQIPIRFEHSGKALSPMQLPPEAAVLGGEGQLLGHPARLKIPANSDSREQQTSDDPHTFQ